jgi:DNA-binding FadR family transcriptional regulator
VHAIGVRILRGDLKPGDPLPTEEELSGELAASRTVLREAVKVLAAKRLVESRPKTGTRVRPRSDWNLFDPDVLAWQIEAGLDGTFLSDTIEFRRLVEPGAARLAAERATEEDVAALEEAYAEMESAGDDRDAFMTPDLRFHGLILEACHNELLDHMGLLIGSILRTLFAVTSSPRGAVTNATPLHGAILAAIKAGDPDAAEAAVHRLLDDTTKTVRRTLRESARAR